MSSDVGLPTATQVEDARRVIADVLDPTPTVTLSLRGRGVLTKLESLQPVGSFKVRGALAAVAAARREDSSGAVIASSAGNHGLGIAHAANLLGVRATVVVPSNASSVKVEKLRRYDIELIQTGDSYDDAQAYALDLAATRSIRYISPFNDTHVIAGQASVFEEMLRQTPEIEHLVVSVGGGGLMAGCLIARELAGRSDVRVTGAQAEKSAAMYYVLRGATMAEVRHEPTIADGLAGGGDDGAVTNEIIAKYQIPLVLVPEAEIRRAVREAAESNGVVMEGSASASYAAITTNLIEDDSSRIGFILCGRNISPDLFLELLSEPLS